MSETRPYGDPVDEPVATDPDAAARADEGLADGARPADEVWTSDAEPAATTTVWTPDRDDEVVEVVETSRATDAAEPATPSGVWTPGDAPERTDPPRLYDAEPAADDGEYVPGAYATRLYDAEPDQTATRSYDADPAPAPAYVAEAETVAVAPVVAEPARQPIFVQAPEAPVARGNRAAAGAIGLLAAVAFAILYLGVGLGLGALAGLVTGDTIVDDLVSALTSWALWVPVAVFFLAFWLLGAIINRGRWGVWVVLGLLVGVAAYGGSIAGALFQAPFWTLTAREGAALAESQLLAPLSVAAFVIGRELTIWFGAWVARRGRRVTELNIEAQREYERTLEAGPKLYAS